MKYLFSKNLKTYSLQAKKLQARNGFSIIEMLVATALFSVVMILAVGALLTVIDGNRKAQALKSVMNNLNFAIESMSRTMRVGTLYNCRSAAPLSNPKPPPPLQIAKPNNCSNGGNLIAFEPFGGDPDDWSDQYVYKFSLSPAPNARGRLERSTDGGDNFIPITAPEVNIEKFVFYVTGAEDDDDEQPRVVMTISGSTGVKAKLRTEFNLQTTVSQRILDLP